LDKALDAINEALTIEPKNLNLTLYSVLVLRDQSKYREAEKRLRQALLDHPNDERVRFNLALVLHERGKRQEAIAEMEMIVKGNPQNSDALNFIAYAYAEDGRDLERAEQLVSRALEIKPSDGFYLDTLGFVYFKRGKMPLAEETLSRAVGITGQDPVIIEHYVQVLVAQQKWQQAVGVLKSITTVELSADEQRDKDKVQSLHRLKQVLDEILKARPELQGVQRSYLIRKPSQRAGYQMPDLGLRTDALGVLSVGAR
jgi:predicted Zn-dependent protease